MIVLGCCSASAPKVARRTGGWGRHPHWRGTVRNGQL